MEEKLANENVITKDDSKDLVVIDYFDRIHNQWIKLEVTKEVANFMKADEQKTRRAQNKFNYYCKPYGNVFNPNKPENEKFLIDESSDTESILENREREKLERFENEHNKVLIENSLDSLTDVQREVVEMTMQNLTQSEMAEKLDISKNAVTSRMRKAKHNIRNYIKKTEN